MEKSRSYMIMAACLSFISQFFNYSNKEFGNPSIDGHLDYHYGYLIPSETGWEMHSWYSGIVLFLILFLFYSKSRSLPYYIVSIIIICFLGLGNGAGGIMGFISIATGGYAIFLKLKENKILKPK